MRLQLALAFSDATAKAFEMWPYGAMCALAALTSRTMMRSSVAEKRCAFCRPLLLSLEMLGVQESGVIERRVADGEMAGDGSKPGPGLISTEAVEGAVGKGMEIDGITFAMLEDGW